MLPRTSSIWQRDSHPTASGKPGAVQIWQEFVTIQTNPEPFWRSHAGLPGMISAGDDRSLVISDQLSRDIAAFTSLVHDNDATLKIVYGSKDIGAVVQRAFGAALADSDLATEPNLASEVLLEKVHEHLREAFGGARPRQIYILGCWLIRDEVASDLSFGPVRFERRERWLDRMAAETQFSAVTCRRLQRSWAGDKLRPRTSDIERWREETLASAIGSCPTVCSVASTGLAGEAADRKAMLAAKLAMTALALFWERPSQALAGFGLLSDGGAQRGRYAVLQEAGGMSSRTVFTKPLGSTWVRPEDWPDLWGQGSWLIDPVAEVLTSLLDPAQPSGRPKVTRSLLHALWWLYEGCRADAPLMAAAKFGACLDTLAGGGTDAGILKLIKARLGASPDDPITPDGRSARSVVRMIYGGARSQTMHGLNDRYDHDWSGTRDLAEHLTRICFVEVLDWLAGHPTATDLTGALAP